MVVGDLQRLGIKLGHGLNHLEIDNPLIQPNYVRPMSQELGDLQTSLESIHSQLPVLVVSKKGLFFVASISCMSRTGS